MLPILINSFFKYLSVIGCYHPIGQAIPLVNNPVSKVKLTHIIFKAKLLESIIMVGVIALLYFLETILYTSIMSLLSVYNAVLLFTYFQTVRVTNMSE